MGLLDDAIREHLELKRQHGGDPSEIERQEQEAFGAGGRRAAPDEADDAPQAAEEDDVARAVPFDDEAPAAAEAPSDPDPRDAAPERADEVDEPPDAERDETAPGREEDPWLVEASADPDLEREEDVLEETPDFLQETPEHDRLWFEQKPPRDFDWDQ